MDEHNRKSWGRTIVTTDEQIAAACGAVYARTQTAPRLFEVREELGTKSNLGGRIKAVLEKWGPEHGFATKDMVKPARITDYEIMETFDELYARTGKPARAMHVRDELGVKYGVKSMLKGRLAACADKWWSDHGFTYSRSMLAYTDNQIYAACDAIYALTNVTPTVAQVKREAKVKTSVSDPIKLLIKKWAKQRALNLHVISLTKDAIHAACQQLYLRNGYSPTPEEVQSHLGAGEIKWISGRMKDWLPNLGKGLHAAGDDLAGYSVEQIYAICQSIHREHKQIVSSQELQQAMGGGDIERIKDLRAKWIASKKTTLLRKIDLEFRAYETLDIRFSEWTEAIRGWMALRESSGLTEKSMEQFKQHMSHFLYHYILLNELPYSIESFLSKSFFAPEVRAMYKDLSPRLLRHKYNLFRELCDWILRERFSTMDENGYPVMKLGYHNPIPLLPADESGKRKQRSVKFRMFKHLLNDVSTDSELRWLTALDPRFEQWRLFAAEWVATQHQALSPVLASLKSLFVDYMYSLKMPPEPEVFLRRGEINAPDYREAALQGLNMKHGVRTRYRHVFDFIEYVLLNYFSAEDDYGSRVILREYHNPIPPMNSATLSGLRDPGDSSNKNVLPSFYIRTLRDFLCPPEAKHFTDLTWAINAMDRSGASGDWFRVDESQIDRDDPDCVWRVKEASHHDLKAGSEELFYEMWCPSRAIALLMKLELPLRTFQVRVLDSGEGDRMRYESGHWVENSRPLSGTAHRRKGDGVFRRISDSLTGAEYTGLYINTNKTKDRMENPDDSGYEVPWSHSKVLYWLEKLRNWQEKYNPIVKRTRWSDLEKKHTGHVKAKSQLVAMGSACFLFRDAADKDHPDMPITSGQLGVIWKKLLIKLERHCEEQGQLSLTGEALKFVPDDEGGDSVFYPLHSLRVSLISHYALEGGVSMSILSKCIAGHSRIIMTMYYTKAGVTYVSEMMDEAGKKILDAEQRNYIQWLKDASLKQAEINSVTIDNAALAAMRFSFDIANGLLKTDKGLCPKGGMGCGDGGICYDEETGKVTFEAVPGYPMERNCVRCRWFITGPAFLLGLHQHWNVIHMALGDAGDRYREIELEVSQLEEKQYNCQTSGNLFTQEEKLASLRKAGLEAFEHNEKLAADSLATLRLIARCQALIHAAKAGAEGVELVASGGIKDINFVIEECSELRQVLTVASSAALFVEEDKSKAVLKAGRAFDLMLHRNGKAPVFFKPSEKELPIVVQQMTSLLQAQAGCIRDAVPFVEGMRPLSELGYDIDGEEVLNMSYAGKPFAWAGKPLAVRNGRVPKLTNESTALEEE